MNVTPTYPIVSQVVYLCFTTKTLHAFLFPLFVPNLPPPKLILLNLINGIKFGDEYKNFNFVCCKFNVNIIRTLPAVSFWYNKMKQNNRCV